VNVAYVPSLTEIFKKKPLLSHIYHSLAFAQNFGRENIKIVWHLMASARARSTENQTRPGRNQFLISSRQSCWKNKDTSVKRNRLHVILSEIPQTLPNVDLSQEARMAQSVA